MLEHPQTEHRWLERLVGEWVWEVEVPAGEGGAMTTATGVERVRSLGGLWVVAEGSGPMPGMDRSVTTVMTLGYSPRERCYVGTWIGSMMSELWVYGDGTLDESGQSLTLNCMGPSMSGDGRRVPYRDVITFRDNDHRVLSAFVQEQDGVWKPLMSMEFRRRG